MPSDVNLIRSASSLRVILELVRICSMIFSRVVNWAYFGIVIVSKIILQSVFIYPFVYKILFVLYKPVRSLPEVFVCILLRTDRNR